MTQSSSSSSSSSMSSSPFLTPPPPKPTAAILIIGNEILSGKIKEENAFYLTQRLRQLGIDLHRLVIVGDRPHEIAHEVVCLSEKYTYVFTSGGVGPTHDDLTLESIAHGFGVETFLHPDLEHLLRHYFKDRLTDDHLRMAKIPTGSELIWMPNSNWPIYTYKNVMILPGVPSIFRSKFESIAHHLQAHPLYVRTLDLNGDEGSIAQTLKELEERFQVSIGSYPQFQSKINYQVRLTFESDQPLQVDQAIDAFLSSNPSLFELVQCSPSYALNPSN